MKDLYLILALDVDGEEHIMRDVYSSEEYAMEALQKYRKEASLRGDKKTMYYYTEATLIK